MKKLFKNIYFVILITITLIIAISTSANADEETTAIGYTSEDTNVFPDKYNTMATAPEGGFTIIERGSTLNVTNLEGQPMTIKFQDSGTEQKINLKYANADLEGTIVFENVDFSATMDKLTILNTEVRMENQKRITFIFRNCVFKNFSGGRNPNDYVHYTFENCTFTMFYGSNADLNRCFLGGGVSDRIVPFCNVSVNNCYIANPTCETTVDGEIHVDGTQIYGWETTDAFEIRFDGSRFEMPALSYPNAPKVYVNACIMLQLEFSNGHDISFTNCYVNGGGMSVYASCKNDRQYSNTYFKNLKFGCARRYSKIYPTQAAGVELNLDTWTDSESIYVGTVYRDSSSQTVNISVTNDTNQPRTFRIYTSSGRFYDFEIEECPLWKDFNGRKFEDFPFDRLFTIPEYSDWVVCYETTGGIFKQIRYVNWGDNELVLNRNYNGDFSVNEVHKVQPTTTVAPNNNTDDMTTTTSTKLTDEQTSLSTSSDNAESTDNANNANQTTTINSSINDTESTLKDQSDTGLSNAENSNDKDNTNAQNNNSASPLWIIIIVSIIITVFFITFRIVSKRSLKFWK